MSEFPKGLKQFFDSDPAIGRIERIGTRPVKRGDVVEVQTWDLDGGQDHARHRETRAVTLIQAEHIPIIQSLIHTDFDPLSLRRNLIVSGINLASLRWSTFAVGEVVLRGTVPCDPCSRMHDLLGPGGYAAMFEMGGLCAAIVQSGTICVGDAVRRLHFTESS